MMRMACFMRAKVQLYVETTKKYINIICRQGIFLKILYHTEFWIMNLPDFLCYEEINFNVVVLYLFKWGKSTR